MFYSLDISFFSRIIFLTSVSFLINMLKLSVLMTLSFNMLIKKETDVKNIVLEKKMKIPHC